MSQELIRIVEKPIGRKSVQAVSARELHEKLGVKTRYDDWMRRLVNSGDWIENKDFGVFLKNEENSQEGRPSTDAALSIQMSEHIAMMTRTLKGREVREYFRQARDERDVMQRDHIPHVVNPANQALIDTIVRLDGVEQRAVAAEQRAHEAEVIAARAEGKADIAFQDSSYLTVEEFVGRNGLLHQFPHEQHNAISSWVKSFCHTHSLSFHRDDVVGKSWETENHYPIQALLAYVRHAHRKPKQIALLRKKEG